MPISSSHGRCPDPVTEATRAVVVEFFEWLQKREGVAAPPFATDAEIWLSGNYWWSGSVSLDEAVRIQTHFHSCFVAGADGIRYNVRSIIADGERAAAEFEMSGEWHDGRFYTETIHAAFQIRAGQIAGYRQYGFDVDFFAREQDVFGASPARERT